MLAPILLFVYKRLDLTQATLAALKENELAAQSELIIYSDGPKTPADKPDVDKLRAYLKEITGFKKVDIVKSEENKGLAKSIVGGVSTVLEKYGKVIVLEDDIVTAPYFLKFMNDALDLYEQEEKVMSISGYMYPHNQSLPPSFFFNVPLCWGWATWKSAWEHFSNDAADHVKYLDEHKAWKEFNKVGGKYLERQLRRNASGKLNTWFVNWHASVFRENGFCLYPGQTLVNNVGFNSTGEHKSTYHNKYYAELNKNAVKLEPLELEEHKEAKKLIRRFYLIKVNSYVKLLQKLSNKLFKN